MLVIGYGNPGRMDDGLGPAFAEEIASAALPGVEVRQDYQLTVEHALALRGVDRVVFADAMIGMGEPFAFRALEPDETGEVGSHSLEPGALLGLAATLFGAAPEAYVMGISGAEFGEVREALSAQARRNLGLAVAHFTVWAGREAAEAAGAG